MEHHPPPSSHITLHTSHPHLSLTIHPSHTAHPSLTTTHQTSPPIALYHPPTQPHHPSHTSTHPSHTAQPLHATHPSHSTTKYRTPPPTHRTPPHIHPYRPLNAHDFQKFKKIKNNSLKVFGPEKDRL
ncbi:uncharacterized protein LOC129753875 [Uranotaenia lowii]|uniref:uncharacterized protein LOC129753875 n=1 Tax=Uranotaenia lowii TaxID=190385 RepID=UPI00247AB235|nr:uncharacterized protein LOC129753875 [Uranotaenia lowii]